MALTTATISGLTAESNFPANNDAFVGDDVSAGTTDKWLAMYLRGAKPDLVVASGSITPNALQVISLNLGTAIALTISEAPAVGSILFIYRKGSGAVTHVVTVFAGVTVDGTNNDLNFDTDGDSIILVAESATRYLVFANNGVTFS
jgi:hypothetical protein